MEQFNWVDYVIIGTISASVILGIFRGFVKEAMSLLTWIAAIAIGVIYCEPLSQKFTNISMIGVRLVLSFVILALGTLIAGGLIGHIISRLINFTGFGVTDRIFGTLFGFARGGIIVALLVMFLTPSQFAQNPNWKSSQLIPKFQPVSTWIKEKIPEDVMQRMQLT